MQIISEFLKLTKKTIKLKGQSVCTYKDETKILWMSLLGFYLMGIRYANAVQSPIFQKISFLFLFLNLHVEIRVWGILYTAKLYFFCIRMAIHWSPQFTIINLHLLLRQGNSINSLHLRLLSCFPLCSWNPRSISPMYCLHLTGFLQASMHICKFCIVEHIYDTMLHPVYWHGWVH